MTARLISNLSRAPIQPGAGTGWGTGSIQLPFMSNSDGPQQS